MYKEGGLIFSLNTVQTRMIHPALAGADSGWGPLNDWTYFACESETLRTLPRPAVGNTKSSSNSAWPAVSSIAKAFRSTWSTLALVWTVQAAAGLRCDCLDGLIADGYFDAAIDVSVEKRVQAAILAPSLSPILTLTVQDTREKKIWGKNLQATVSNNEMRLK